eukprot:CAMPEP_0172312896 /NCGR_PEP_ID=MMETSP1058-20130122/18751_1 /TAXON_ID=83371 /ORGANISM="Detonula confervacea, Strain CCMP 353" /LENGTH=342 /DNA_ID=CAMNT_0013026453 /DNA_START=14 /DNA_END=1042 /DNA_ORIENTATION=+
MANEYHNSRKLQNIVSPVPETTFEFYSDAVLATAFLLTAIVAAKRMSSSRSHGGAETTVVTAFYSLILLTASLRTIWFMIPGTVWSPYYTPHAVMAFDSEHPYWIMEFLEIILLGAGSLCLFSIFILILVYWADILKKYFYPGARRSKPMITFLVLVSVLIVIQMLNAILFLFRDYSSEGMILVNSVTLSLVSVVCVCEITIFSHRFRTVLKTLGDINQVSTESQVKRIVWITVTGNLFFFTRAFLETIFAILLVVYWHQNGTVAEAFSHSIWDAYILLKHWSELAILGLMLYILQNRFSNGVEGTGEGLNVSNHGYQTVPETNLCDADFVTDESSPSTLSV